MGHANLSNISDFFIRRLYAKGKLTIEDCVKAMIEKGETVHASEGEYEDEYMLSMSTEWVVSFLIGINGNYYVPPQKEVILIPASLSDSQKEVLEGWQTDQETEWDEPQWKILDSIKWKFAPGWRKKYSTIPRLGNVTN